MMIHIKKLLPAALLIASTFGAYAADCVSERIYIGTHQPAGAPSLFTATFDARIGALSAARAVSSIERPTWLLKDPTRPVLYSVSETGNDGKSEGKVFSLRIGADGSLQEISSVPSGGGGPTHLALDAKARSLFVAHYGGGQASTLPVGVQGDLSSPTSVVTSYGTGPTPRQQSPHAHGVTLDPTGKFLLVPDLGADRVFVYRVSADLRKLTPATTPFVQLPPGSGPRHLTFNPDGRHAYLLNELTADLLVYAWDAHQGALQPLQTLSTLSQGYDGKKSAGDFVVSNDGHRIYLSNRAEDSIVVYGVNAQSGELTELQRIAAGGTKPWHVALSPDGAWLLASNEGSNAITVFSVSRGNGRLTASDSKLDVGTPVIVVFSGMCVSEQ